MSIIKLSPEFISVLENHGSIVNTRTNKYLYFPFWIKVNPEGCELFSLENLPQELEEVIKASRNQIYLKPPS